jgi:hypothetical protein
MNATQLETVIKAQNTPTDPLTKPHREAFDKAIATHARYFIADDDDTRQAIASEFMKNDLFALASLFGDVIDAYVSLRRRSFPKGVACKYCGVPTEELGFDPVEMEFVPAHRSCADLVYRAHHFENRVADLQRDLAKAWSQNLRMSLERAGCRPSIDETTASTSSPSPSPDVEQAST